MSNRELYLKFIEIAASNPLDGYCQLKDFRREYKKTEFYKKTRLPLHTAYKYAIQSMGTQLYFKLCEIMDVTSWSDKINDFMEDLDPEMVENWINKITSVFNFSNLDSEKGELQNLLAQMTSLM
jgi:hypothetical protein